MIEVPVSKLVTDTSTVEPETSAMEAAGYLRQPEEPALVVREGEDVVGVVTESDVVAVVAEGGSNPPVASFMSAPVVTVPPSTHVGLAADRMRDAGVGLLPVVDEGGTYHGVVTREALAPYLSRHRLEITWDSDPLTLGGSDGAESAGLADPDSESSDARATE
jgi:CBS domain-containing protein